MPDPTKQRKETIKSEDFKKQLELLAQETKKLEAQIQVLQKMFDIGNFRML